MVTLMKFIKAIFGDENSKLLKKYKSIIPVINNFGEEYKNLSDVDLSEKTLEFRKRLKEGATLESLLPEAFAVVRETAARTLKERPYDVQLIGGMAIHDGNISEMRTGEGKTLVATLPAYLNALSGNGVHVITVNDYLARRDAVWMGQIFDFLGLKTAIINQGGSYMYDPSHVEKDEERDKVGSYRVVYDFLRPISRQEAYQADITYGTNSEFGFDYLRDNIEYQTENLRQTQHNFAIIDEIDSILIDEARTPLIISAPSTQAENLYEVFAGIAKQMNVTDDFTVDEKSKSIELTDAGITKAEKLLGVENIYTEKGVKYVHHLETAVRAKALFNNDKEYVVKDGQVVIVDEFTGRLQPSRRWSGGLHQAIEAKEGMKIAEESRTFASITYQNYFRLYKKLSGMTGTADTSKEEFYKVYGLDVVIIPTNKDVARLDEQDLIFQTERGKFKAIARKIKELNQKGIPVLIGTVSIEKNELLSNYLNAENIVHKILNAKNHENEAEIIAQAGKRGAVTIATNMAGRGVDIKLGGVPFDKEKYEEIKNIGGLYVIGTERHEARRIDNQLRGRSGRQGDPGETQFFVSLEDSLMRIFAGDTIKGLMGKLGIAEDEPIQNGMISKSLEGAQSKIEGFNFDSRKHLLEYDNVLNVQRKAIYERRKGVLIKDKEKIDAEIEQVIEHSANENLREIVAQKKDSLGDEWYEVVRRLLLQSIDTFWVDHLEVMDFIRSSVGLRAYGQRDPLIEYKKEGLKLYKEMLAGIYNQVGVLIPTINADAFVKAQQEMQETMKRAKEIGSSTANDQIGDGSSVGQEFDRNEKVTIEKGGETLEIKFKKAESYLRDGWKIVQK